MIKIQIPTNMNELLENHWDWFKNEFIGNDSKKKDFITSKLNLRNINEFERIIKADYDEMCSYIEQFSEMSLSSEEKIWFGYDAWSRRKNGWNALKYMQNLNVKVCPYCNRNNIDYTDIRYEKLLSQQQKRIPRASFDHFFPKNIYPYLSCSLLNLIPCCNTCNSAKHSQNVKIIYPYENDFGENGKFVLKYDITKFNMEVFNKKNNGSIEDAIFKDLLVELKTEDPRIKNSKTVFHLETLYSQEHNFIRDLLDKLSMYLEGWDRAKLLTNSEKVFFKLFFDLPRDSNKIYPYQKITMDIIKQYEPRLANYL